MAQLDTITWAEIAPHIDLTDIYLPTPKQRHDYLIVLHRRPSCPKWTLSNTGCYGFTSVHHPFYHSYEKQQLLWAQLDYALIKIFPDEKLN